MRKILRKLNGHKYEMDQLVQIIKEIVIDIKIILIF